MDTQTLTPPAQTTKRIIKRAAVLGSGVMGSRIAAHFANAGLEVLLLDIVPQGEAPAGLKPQAFRNSIAQKALETAIKSSPAPLFDASLVSRIKIGNLDDNLADLAGYDWILEAIVENLEIKKVLYEKLDKVRKPGTIISSNTSGIPIHFLSEGRSDDFKRHFLGTHFFNPPRYLQLLEIIPTKDTDASVTQFMMNFGSKALGKTTVLAKDTPAFIANRVGVFSIMDVLKIQKNLGLTIDEVDKLTGPVIGHPKSATFRTSDVVGLDTLIKVADGLFKGLQNDDQKGSFEVPEFLRKMEVNKWLGDKTGQGFYKKTGSGAEKQILSLNLETMEYQPQAKAKFATLETTKSIENLADRWKVLVKGQDKAGQFYVAMLGGLFAYVSNRIPEIADAIYQIDAAMRAGFGWEQGPFETWNSLGLKRGADLATAQGHKMAPWVDEAIANGVDKLYDFAGGVRKYYDPATGGFKEVPAQEGAIELFALKNSDKKVWGNSGSSLYDIGDGILCLEFHTKMNTMGSEVIEGVNKAISLSEKSYQGLVIGNQGANFSAGANLGMVFMYAVEEEWDELDMMIRQFQSTMMRVRYSAIPVVVAPHGLTLGGGCEMTMHADRVQAAAETYIGLVEVGVGVIPGGGGSKEMALRISDSFENGDIEINALLNTFKDIATAKVATSAQEAFGMRILRRGDQISMNKSLQIGDAKALAMELAAQGYVQPAHRNNIKVLGKSALGTLLAGIEGMRAGHYATDHDAKVATKLAFVLAGGDLSSPTYVNEQYLLDLEREAFLSLCGERKTLERIQAVLQSGRPIRN